jgi:hypothetical protein
MPTTTAALGDDELGKRLSTGKEKVSRHNGKRFNKMCMTLMGLEGIA